MWVADEKLRLLLYRSSSAIFKTFRQVLNYVDTTLPTEMTKIEEVISWTNENKEKVYDVDLRFFTQNMTFFVEFTQGLERIKYIRDVYERSTGEFKTDLYDKVKELSQKNVFHHRMILLVVSGAKPIVIEVSASSHPPKPIASQDNTEMRGYWTNAQTFFSPKWEWNSFDLDSMSAVNAYLKDTHPSDMKLLDEIEKWAFETKNVTHDLNVQLLHMKSIRKALQGDRSIDILQQIEKLRNLSIGYHEMVIHDARIDKNNVVQVISQRDQIPEKPVWNGKVQEGYWYRLGFETRYHWTNDSDHVDDDEDYPTYRRMNNVG